MITWLQLSLAVLPYALLALFYLAKVVVNRRLVSAATAWLASGWVYALARDNHLLTRVSAAVLVSVACLMGWLAFGIVVHIEKQRPR